MLAAALKLPELQHTKDAATVPCTTSVAVTSPHLTVARKVHALCSTAHAWCRSADKDGSESPSIAWDVAEQRAMLKDMRAV
jgi:hypothetical protein